MLFVTSQREIPVDSHRRDKLLEERRWELDALSGGAAHDDMPDRAAIIVQILIRRNAQMKFVSVHAKQFRQQTPNRPPRQARLAGSPKACRCANGFRQTIRGPFDNRAKSARLSARIKTQQPKRYAHLRKCCGLHTSLRRLPQAVPLFSRL